MTTIQSANRALRLILELCVLIALCFWGFHIGHGPILKAILGIGAPVVAAFIWARYGAPKSTKMLRGPARTWLEVAMFGVAALALFTAGQRALALMFVIVAIANRVILPKAR